MIRPSLDYFPQISQGSCCKVKGRGKTALVLGGGTRLGVVVEDGLTDMDVLLLAERVVDLVLGLVLLHPGKTLSSSQTGLLLVLELIGLLELALILVVLLGVGGLAFMFPIG